MQPITKAADLLNISEYRLFCEAYFTWFGDRADDTDITIVFSQFKMFGEVPEWADMFARHVLVDLEANRQVNLNSFCVLNLSPRVGQKPEISFSIMR